MMDILAVEDRYTSGLYTKRPIAIVRGQAAHLWDSHGRMYIDCVGGQGAANIGHANPQVAQAVAEQAQRLISCPEMFYNDRRAALEERLCQVSGYPRVFLCNSGAEANEAAIKFARLTTGRSEIIAFKRAFHGRTFGALSATWEKKYRQPFEPLVPGFTHLTYNDPQALQAAVSDQTAAVLLEVVQGEGGVHPASREFLTAAQQVCRERGALLIVDEVQTGFGRTGKLFAFQHYDLQPDLVCLAKSIAGGLPMGAVLIGERVGSLPPQTHGSTFGGNPLTCAAALASLNFLLENHLPEQAAELGGWFIEALRRLDSPQIREVRGLGLMVGIELKQKVTPYLQALMNEGVLALPAGLTVMRFLPPLVIEKSDLERVVEAVALVLTQEAAEWTK
ncbi:acetylornithine aminotransferase apoenzyme [Bellilinea caldifistulae]|uniref:Putative [LysW]-aminoadipate semialdehyde transaminase n=1 Tax=Bellilinea caldifistulae TaxID=360411 RepID=A0A0P6Y574_9CHLR|nr:aspartate aminotransferase family protein [Bellilinea caldifistulae]KPL76739.1 acetylornithine aminotransferase [Bellilinea caldifistulae]GAP08942.1 acetylornithine aminotransferase apoenzyme [Bellilinea caldifistulae]